MAMLKKMGRGKTMMDQKALDPDLYDLSVGHEIDDGRAVAFVRHVRHFNTGHGTELLGGEMSAGRVTGRAEVDAAGFGLGESYQFAERAGSDGCATSTYGTVEISVTGAKSFSWS